jgi:hypothetical protein
MQWDSSASVSRWLILHSIIESELVYDWRFTANQFILATSPLRLTNRLFFQLNTCDHSPYVTSSLTRGWVYRLQLLLALASAYILGSESLRTHDHILLFHIRVSLNLEARSPYLYPPGTWCPSYNPQALGSLFVASYDSQGYGGGIRPRLHNLEGKSAMPWRINSRSIEYKKPPQQCHHFLRSYSLPRRHELLESSLLLRLTVSQALQHCNSRCLLDNSSSRTMQKTACLLFRRHVYRVVA